MYPSLRGVLSFVGRDLRWADSLSKESCQTSKGIHNLKIHSEEEQATKSNP
jgi:hypothetical protein